MGKKSHVGKEIYVSRKKDPIFQKEMATYVSEWCHIGVWSMS